MRDPGTARPDRLKIVLPIELQMRSVEMDEIIGTKRFPRYVYYLTQEELGELESRAVSEQTSVERELVQHVSTFINSVEHTGETIRQMKRNFPELSHATIVIDVKLTGKIEWVS